MGHIYKALRQAEEEPVPSLPLPKGTSVTPDLLQDVESETAQLAEVPIVKPVARFGSRLVTLTDRDDLGAEKFRLLRTRLRHLQDKSELKKVLITSAVPGDGKTMIASNLAITLSGNSMQKILLLEGDLRHPALADRFGLQGLQGLVEWFQGEDPLTRFIYRIDGLQLWFLPAGDPAVDALKILQSNRFFKAMNRLAAYFDWIVIDAPPLEPLADVHVWAEQSDGVLLVIRDGKTSKKLLLKGLNSLDGAKLLGVVFNDTSSIQHTYYQQYYGRSGASKSNRKGTNGNGAGL